MLFDINIEILQAIFGFLDPDDFINVQSLKPSYSLLTCYRHAHGYSFHQSEMISFTFFRDNLFVLRLYRQPQRVPPTYINGFKLLAPPLLKMISVRATTSAAQTILALHNLSMVSRKNTTWPVYLLLAAQAQQGKVTDISIPEEIELAITLVRYGRHHSVNILLKDYHPRSEEMVKCMLHYALEPRVSFSLLSQDLCNYWFSRAPCDSQTWLINHLPSHIDITFLILANPHRFIGLATFATLKRFKIIENRERWIKQSSFFFPAIFSHRKKCHLTLTDLTELSNFQIAFHGKIAHLITNNLILLRSPLFRPPLYILEQGAQKGDIFFHHHIGRLLGLSTENVKYLRALSHPRQQAQLPFLPYIFSDRPSIPLIGRQQALEIVFESGPVELITLL